MTIRTLLQTAAFTAGIGIWVLAAPPAPAIAQGPPPTGECGIYGGPICSTEYRCTIYNPDGTCASVEITQLYYE